MPGNIREGIGIAFVRVGSALDDVAPAFREAYCPDRDRVERGLSRLGELTRKIGTSLCSASEVAEDERPNKRKPEEF